ncbi:MAG: hypothetical protein ABSC23_19690 [Bryobacteraceae bacterium]|jgi:hypothetical protein
MSLFLCSFFLVWAGAWFFHIARRAVLKALICFLSVTLFVLRRLTPESWLAGPSDRGAW